MQGNGNKKKIIIIIVVALVAVMAAAGAFVYYYNLPENRVLRAMDSAQEYFKNNQWEEAKAELNAIIEIDPNNIQAYKMLAEIYLEEANSENAIECYEKIIEIDNSNVDAYLALGEIYSDAGEYDKALEILEEGYANTNSNRIQKAISEINAILDAIKAEEVAEEQAMAELEKEVDFDTLRNDYIDSYGWGYEIGKMMPDCELYTLDGNVVYLSDFLGKPLYINLFTTWCPYCDMEVGDMQATYDTYGADIEYIMIDLGETADDARWYANEFGLSIPMYTEPDWYLGNYDVTGVPTTFVLDKYGRIVDKANGMAEAYWIENATIKAIEASAD